MPAFPVSGASIDGPSYRAGYDRGFFISPSDPEQFPFEFRFNNQAQLRYAGFAPNVDAPAILRRTLLNLFRRREGRALRRLGEGGKARAAQRTERILPQRLTAVRGNLFLTHGRFAPARPPHTPTGMSVSPPRNISAFA